MARLPRSGASFSSLYEYEITLKDVISRLGFRPLSKEDEAFVRCVMGRAIGEWGRSEGNYKESGAKLNIKDVQQTLAGLATRLDEVNDILAAAEEGIHHTHVIEVVGQITSALSQNPEIGSAEQAQKFLVDFRDRAGTVAHGAWVASWLLSTLPKQPHGRIRQDWHDDFTRAVARVCELNDVAPKIIIDRVTREPKGRFFEAATALERLLKRRLVGILIVARIYCAAWPRAKARGIPVSTTT
jgi:hypothetical protein